MDRTSRPPSEQGIEYQTLDALAELARKVDELTQRPSTLVHGNWWDVLPSPGPGRSWAEIFPESGPPVQWMVPTRNSSMYTAWRALFYPDRLELSIQLNGGWLVWQRALFFNEPMGGLSHGR